MTNHTSPSPEIRNVRVGDCMHRGILSCASDAPLGEVAGVMAKYHVHAVAVTNGIGDPPMGIASALDVVSAVATGEHLTARQVACSEPLTVSADESLQRAAQVMTEHAASHLVVVDSAGGHPVGVLSTLDVAAAYAN